LFLIGFEGIKNLREKKGSAKSYAVPVAFTVEFGASVPEGVIVGLTV
jgi:hypothetical protein